jgi:hypothetical protein
MEPKAFTERLFALQQQYTEKQWSRVIADPRSKAAIEAENYAVLASLASELAPGNIVSPKAAKMREKFIKQKNRFNADIRALQ